ncbi:MAG: GatB/YqeY domain-containing protein [Alphaproteobacteria bacterium]|nr:GatB/YqeY domain-containing protein [Alphaproteobacteria bacterium]
MSLRTAFNDGLKEAMKAKDQRRVSTLRLINSAIKDADIAARTESSREGISDADILILLGKMVRQREESVDSFEKGGRPELAASERAEIEIIRAYMPKQMSREDLAATLKTLIAELGATQLKDMGKVLAILKERHAGSYDAGQAGPLAKELLSPPK